MNNVGEGGVMCVGDYWSFGEEFDLFKKIKCVGVYYIEIKVFGKFGNFILVVVGFVVGGIL